MEPQLRRAYLVGAVAGLSVGIAVAWFVLRPILDLVIHQDEERPPVVVSNGSVKLEVEASVSPAQRGEFRPVQGATVYRHTGDDETKDKTVTSIDLLVEGTSAPACVNEVTNLSTFTIVTNLGEIAVSLRPRGGAGSKVDVLYTFQSNVTKPKKNQLLLGDHKLQSVKFAQGGPPVECTFDAPTEDQRLRIQPR